ncbi:MAG: Hint domain-containing protein, partial [Pseudomonadota bacterium]
PAKHLVNGITIYPMDVRNVTTISYYHLELDAHDAVVAEGLAAETYRDTGQRSSFDQTQAHQGFKLTEEIAAPFAPLVALHRRRDTIASHLRSAGSILFDQRGQFEMTRDRLFDRAVEIEELRSNSLAA